ncbi:MAG: hypothetical protein IJ336_07355 [Lachnospiraceae bacterium]|nr:hypothetical protein [Lachnospiraceae bacterium]
MKFSLFKNDKSTFWDEVILAAISLVCLAVGIVIIILKPSFWIIEASMTVTAGVLIATVGVMFIPALIYRLMTNDK